MEENGSLSDSELQYGLPSDEERGLPEEIANEAIGIAVPTFLNKLREETRPLLSLSKGVPSPTKQLKENGSDKLKESRAKKRLFRGKQEPPNGVIERRYGYIPNPRWGKSVSNSQGRQFVPQGVTEHDRSGVPGVVFRDTPKSEASCQELEFPELGASDHDSRLSPVPESTHSNNQVRQAKGNQNRRINLLNESRSPIVQGRPSVSPITSTPVRWGGSQGHSSLESTYHSAESTFHSAVEFTEDPSRSINSSIKSVGSSLSLERSLSASKTHNVSSSSGKRSGKKLAPSPLAASVVSPATSSGIKHRSDSNQVKVFNSWSDVARGSSLSPGPSVCEVDQRADFIPVKASSSWSDVARGSHSPSPGNPPSTSLAESDVHRANRNVWSPKKIKQPVAGSSEPQQNSQAIHSLSTNPKTWPLTNATSTDSGKLPICNDKLSDVTNKSKFVGGQLQETVSKVESPVNSLAQFKHNQAKFHPHQEDSSTTHINQKPEKQRKNKQRKPRSSGSGANAQSTSSLIDISGSASPSPAWQGKDRKQNSKGKSSNKGPSHFTLEHFMTPQKVNNKKTGVKSDKKDMLMLENRFVEHIAANPTSPPKKLRPSPIKKLSFSGKESELEIQESESIEPSVRGEADSVNSQSGEKGKTIGNCKTSIVEKVAVPSAPLKNSVIFSMKQYFKAESVDKFEEENEDEYPHVVEKEKVQQFWKDTFALPSHPATPRKVDLSNCGDGENEFESDACGHFLSPLPQSVSVLDHEEEEAESLTAGHVVEADPGKVQHKNLLIKKAQRYCHYFEEHQVPNIAVELYFVVQLLTCTEVDKDILRFVDVHSGRTVFRSVHNGVYFAVKVMKRLRRLFASLSKTYVELLADCQRIKDFSPFLHKYFKQELQKRIEDPSKASFLEHTAFSTEEDGLNSFPDANYAHVFKCQRDNFYAFYRHYHDTNSIYEFKIEHQIQYVYDGCTAEQNSMVNLMHLAKLFVDHLVLCCVTQRPESVDLLEMIHSKGVDEKQFTKLYEAFVACAGSSLGTACPAPGFSDHHMFFRDFLETLSSPAFNEHLKNLLVTKILELNAESFGLICNLHSASTVEENKTPMRSRTFTETVLTLTILAKNLGYLTFVPYSSGFQSLSQKQASSLHSMREMTPLPLPLPLLLKQAFNEGHLSLTVPWIVEFLSQMDSMAPQLSIFSSLLHKLHFIQSYAWDSLYREGHVNSGLLVASCISWLFESPPVPSGFFYSCKSSLDGFEESHPKKSMASHIDRQKLVSQSLLTSCCPYLEQGQVLLTLFALQQKVPVVDHPVIPLTECSGDTGWNARNQNSKAHKDVEQIEKWLGSSMLLEDNATPGTVEEKRLKNVIDDEVVPAYVLTRLLAGKDTDDLEDMENHLLQSNPFMRSMVGSAVELVCAKVVRYTHNTILRLLLFTCKAEVRQQFQDVADALTAEQIKNQVLTGVNLAAGRLSDTAKTSFYQVAERVCEGELPSLLCFLSTAEDRDEAAGFVCVTRRLCFLKLSEWSQVQLGPELFSRAITREAMKCARVPGKPVALYPNDYTKKSEEYVPPEIRPGFVELEQLSELIDTALSHGVWYINALTPGQRPSSWHIVKLIKDFTSCVEKKMITMDFAFYVMSNFLMHLIIQYMVDAPSNWTEEAEQTFLHLCVLCKERKMETENTAVQLPSVPGGRKNKPGLRMKVKVLNLLSVHTLAWLAKTQVQDETMMVYCRLLCGLILSGVLHVETVCSRLSHSRNNPHLCLLAKTLANRAMVKVLSLLYWSIIPCTHTDDTGAQESQELEGCGADQREASYRHQEAGEQGKRSLVLESYNQERVIAVVNSLWAQSSSCPVSSSHLDKTVQEDLVSRLEVAFGNVLVRDGSVYTGEKH